MADVDGSIFRQYLQRFLSLLNMCKKGRGLQLTLAILKPDLMLHPIRTKAVKQIITNNKFTIVKSRLLQWSRNDAELFYAEHKGRFFHNRLVGFMSSGPMTAMILGRENAISYWRQLMGPTHSYRARTVEPDSIRALYGISDTRNATHGSDSDESAKKEIKFFFPDFDYQGWFKSQAIREGTEEEMIEPRKDVP